MSAARDYGLDDDYQWARPPEGGWTADDLDELPNLPPHTELIDGSLVFVSPRTNFHSRAIRLLDNSLLDQVPDELDVIREMTISSTIAIGRSPTFWSSAPAPTPVRSRPGTGRRMS